VIRDGDENTSIFVFKLSSVSSVKVMFDIVLHLRLLNGCRC